MTDVKNNSTNDASQLPLQTEPIFRKQAIELASTRQYGSVVLASYISVRLLVAFFSAIALGIISFFIFFTATRKAETSGLLLPNKGLIRVRSGQAGLVKQILVKEGQSVRAGEVLVVLSNERNIGTIHSAESTVSTLLQHQRESYYDELVQATLQSSQRLSASQKKLIALKDEGIRLDFQINLQRSRVALASQALQRFKDLRMTNYISVAQLEDKEAELLDQSQRLAEFERLKITNRRDCVSAEAEYRELQYQAQRDESALKRGALTVQQDIAENEARREIHVTAPTAGTVTTIAAEVGNLVSADSTLTSILPKESELEAEIYAPSRSVGFVKPGMKVLLRYQAYPYQKFGQYEAVVYEVTGTSMWPQDLALPGIAAARNKTTEPLYRIRLKLKQQTIFAYGKPVNLKPGMLVDASIVLEHKRLYEWILDPLFSILGRG